MKIKYLYIQQTKGKIIKSKKYKFSYLSKKQFRLLQKERLNKNLPDPIITGSISLKNLKHNYKGKESDKMLVVDNDDIADFYIKDKIVKERGYLEVINTNTNEREYAAIENKFPLFLIPLLASIASCFVVMVVGAVFIEMLNKNAPDNLIANIPVEENVTEYNNEDIEFQDPQAESIPSEAIEVKGKFFNYFDITDSEGYDSIPLTNDSENVVDLQYIIFDSNKNIICKSDRIKPGYVSNWKATNVLKKGENKVYFQIVPYMVNENNELLSGFTNSFDVTINYK